MPLDTILQPKIKKKKSVGKLEVKDTNKASKYLLTTQDVDSQGHMETKLVKVSGRSLGSGWSLASGWSLISGQSLVDRCNLVSGRSLVRGWILING